MAFDQVVINVSGRLHATATEPPEPREVLDSYRGSLRQRADASGGLWTSPGSARVRFETMLARSFGTVAGTALRARWADQEHELSLTLTVNPTRTLLHVLTILDDADDPVARLEALRMEEFFGRSAVAATVRTLDRNDNAFDNLDSVISRIGRDHAGTIIGIFERKLKRWAMEAAAPRAQGFQHEVQGGLLIAESDTRRVTLDWGNLSVRRAEVYCERRHGDAVGLMNRLSSTVLAAHVAGDWRTYPIGKIGGRVAGSTVIGIKPTSRVEQVYYAKTTDRVRIETRYLLRVRDHLRGTPISLGSPLHDILLGLRRDAATRLCWDSFCAMAEEPPIPMVADFARLAGIIARCATQANVDPKAVFAELVGSGGLTETPTGGAFPRRLMRRLEEQGLIHRASLIRRSRPGQPRRHHLVEPYLTVARMLQQAFSQTPATGDDQD